MQLTKLLKGLREVPIELQRFVERRYPAFVSDPKVEALGDEVPVFMFHSVERSTFEERLDYLKRNRYRTLTLKEFMAFLRGDTSLKGPSVLLTFDDGHKSWYEVAFPLLKVYGYHAVGFLIPSRVLAQPGPNGSSPWLSWTEVCEMEQSGIMEMESHTYRHDCIFVKPQLIDFFHPQSPYCHNPLGIDAPWIGTGEGYTNHLQWGTPIYKHASRFSEHPRLMDDPQVRQACVTWVEQQGGEAFFRHSHWRSELKKYHQKLAPMRPLWHYESEQQQKETIYSELLLARNTLQERLNKVVSHLCYPWGEGSQLALSLSQEAGYTSNFWVAPGFRRSNRTGDSPFYIPRIKDDYIFRLPGKGRKPLLRLLQGKLRHRAEKQYLY